MLAAVALQRELDSPQALLSNGLGVAAATKCSVVASHIMQLTVVMF